MCMYRCVYVCSVCCEAAVCDCSGTLSLTDNAAQEQLRRELENNPDLLTSTRQRVLAELDAALNKRGIVPVCTVSFISAIGYSLY